MLNEMRRNALERTIKSHTFCQESRGRGSSRIHPLKHCLYEDADHHAPQNAWNRQIFDKLFTDIYQKGRTLASESTFKSISDIESVTAIFIEQHKEEILRWVESCDNYGQEHDGKILQDTDAQRFVMSSSRYTKVNEDDPSTKIQDTLQIQKYQKIREGDALPNSVTVAIDMDSTAETHPIDFRICHAKNATVILNYNPTSPYGFDICTVIPETQLMTKAQFYGTQQVHTQLLTDNELADMRHDIRMRREYQSQSIYENIDYLLMMLNLTDAKYVKCGTETFKDGSSRDAIQILFPEEGNKEVVYTITEDGVRRSQEQECVTTDDPHLRAVMPEILRYIDLEHLGRDICELPRCDTIVEHNEKLRKTKPVDDATPASVYIRDIVREQDYLEK